MLTIGITGGIGSGKTTACTVFETLGAPVYYADTRAKELMNTDRHLKALLQEHFGTDIYQEGRLNRKQLSALIFNDEKRLQMVNGWVHPAVARDFESWLEEQSAPYVLEETAILFESGISSRFDKVILVTAPEDMRVERVCRRDAVPAATVKARMTHQWPEEKKTALADFIIYNDERHQLIPQIISIHKQLLEWFLQKN
ncbi:MAG: dephospho-CoA kinase [Bacteroidales bacterium]|jgi:dephospho-CoA kinase|nr:dephospho-CoA kinase [Bacteroidales bacterium]